MADYTLSNFSRLTLNVGQTLTFDVTDSGILGAPDYPYTVAFQANHGSFSPTTAAMTDGAQFSITYTATSAGSDTISSTNGGNAVDPAGQAITITAPAAYPPLAGTLRSGLLGRGLLGGVLRR